MSFSNQEYIYGHLPARYRGADRDLFLKRFLQHLGTTLDEWDGKFDAFFESIDPETADGEWIEFWLEALFGWSWFPRFFTLQNKRQLYGNFARHLARRGTRRGIELWLLDFGIVARVHTRTPPWGEFVWGEATYAITSPLHLVVEILFLQLPEVDMSFWGEAVWGESYYTEPQPMFSEKEILDLIRFVQPHSQEITVVWRTMETWPSELIVWEQISW